ncbi:Glycosyltransferase, group 1 family protein [Paraburkholderia piptadeniae]|uniref:Glycosyltransferase, group 1 family protein n=1 Tax=Paraburkholderia piptadeniae TaxID=1701573 RepID=A0A1N7SKW5_9BURK|nr:glycosyltransferase family 4 protein [Paraburkholderia piptadeniae]SIT48036.1 Glycosyltransferase, group 1 family protein [Paraburkholderia piptadeniae]
MKITFILPRLTAGPTGGGKIVYQYANALASAGHTVEVLHPRTLFLWSLRKSFALKLLSLGVDCARFAAVWPTRGKTDVPWMPMHPAVKISVVPALFSRFIPDADVIVASLWRTAEYVEHYPACKGRKFYFVQHYETWSGPAHRVDGTLKSTMNKIVISTWLKQLINELSGDEVHQVSNPVDHGEFFVTASIAKRPRVVSMLYSPHAWKGAADGVAALEQAKTQFPELQAILFGTSARPDFLPGWITYVQNPERQVLRDAIYNGSSIYVCPSWREGWGLPVLEAMACGCAVVTTDNGGTRDFVIDGDNGIVVPPKEPRALSKALLSLLADDERRAAFAARSIELAQRSTLQASLDKLLTVLAENPAAGKP